MWTACWSSWVVHSLRSPQWREPSVARFTPPTQLRWQVSTPRWSGASRGCPGKKGVIFANVENVILYPITLFEDNHPAIRMGQVGRYFNWPAFWQSVPRHIAFGAVLG